MTIQGTPKKVAIRGNSDPDARLIFGFRCLINQRHWHTHQANYATEIKVRAERKAGEMLRIAAEQGMRAKTSDGGRPSNNLSNESTSSPPTLAEIGITRDQSSRYQKLAAMPDEHFETAVETAKASAGEVTTAFMLREAAKHADYHPKSGRRPQARVIDCEAHQVERGASTVTFWLHCGYTVENRRKNSRQIL